MQQEEKNSIKEQKLIACWWYKNIKNFRFSNLMCSNIFQSQKFGERLWINYSTLLLMQIFFHWRHFIC